MTIHVSMPEAGRKARHGDEWNSAESRVDVDEWKYDIGQCVTHCAQTLPSLVVGRTTAYRRDGSIALRIYAVRSIMFEDCQRDRMIVEDGLRRTERGEPECSMCLLAQTSLCPSLRDS